MQSCQNTLQSKLLQNASVNVCQKTNVIALTVEVITLSFVSFVRKMHKLKHIQKPTTQPQIHGLFYIFTQLCSICHPVTKMEKSLKGFQLVKLHCMADFSSIFIASIWEFPLNAINSCYIKTDDFMDIFESQSNQSLSHWFCKSKITQVFFP